jgi:hypothetical protein
LRKEYSNSAGKVLRRSKSEFILSSAGGDSQ